MARRRNVLLMVVDQWRADFVPKLGADFLRTPTLDRPCAEGVTFASQVTNAVPCGPAHASRLTGLHQNATFTAKRRSLPWRAAQSFGMDFSHRNWGA